MGKGIAKPRHAGEQEFELNIAPIIDCFTVLITYLLVSASFISLGVLDVSVATPSAGAALPDEPKTSVSIELNDNMTMIVRVTGSEEKNVRVPAKTTDTAKEYDYDHLRDVILVPLKEKHPDLDQTLISAEENVDYVSIVRAVETTRKIIPGATLGDKQVN